MTENPENRVIDEIDRLVDWELTESDAAKRELESGEVWEGWTEMHDRLLRDHRAFQMDMHQLDMQMSWDFYHANRRNWLRSIIISAVSVALNAFALVVNVVIPIMLVRPIGALSGVILIGLVFCCRMFVNGIHAYRAEKPPQCGLEGCNCM